MANQALAVEGLTVEQLGEKRGKRTGTISGLRPESEVGQFLVKLAEKNCGVLNAAEDALLAAGKLTVDEANRAGQQECVKQLRKAVTEATSMLNQMRMGIEEGLDFACKMFRGAADYEDFTEEEKRQYKKLAKEKEKEKEREKEQAMKQAEKKAEASQQAGGSSGYKWPSDGYRSYGGRGRGMPYTYGAGGQYQPYGGFVEQQTAAPQFYGGMQTAMAAGVAPTQMMGAGMGQQMQQVGQPMAMGGQQMPVMGQQFQQQMPLAPQAQYGTAMMQGHSQMGSFGGHQGFSRPPMMRMPRQQARGLAICYNCGEDGHYSRDGVCLQENVDKFHAMMRQQAAALQAAGGAQGQQPAAVAANGAAAITYMASGAAAPGAN